MKRGVKEEESRKITGGLGDRIKKIDGASVRKNPDRLPVRCVTFESVTPKSNVTLNNNMEAVDLKGDSRLEDGNDPWSLKVGVNDDVLPSPKVRRVEFSPKITIHPYEHDSTFTDDSESDDNDHMNLQPNKEKIEVIPKNQTSLLAGDKPILNNDMPAFIPKDTSATAAKFQDKADFNPFKHGDVHNAIYHDNTDAFNSINAIYHDRADFQAGNQFMSNNINVNSYAAKVQGHDMNSKVNFRSLQSVESDEDVDVVIPIEAVKKVQERFSNVLYGYFLGERLAYPVVDYFVKNNWGKWGLKKVMMNANGFFFFKFDSKDGVDMVLSKGPWLIRNTPLFLKTWSPNVALVKENVKKVSIWVKMHDVPIAAYTDDGLSMIATKLGNPKVLDSHTTSMCINAWGRPSFARAIVEVDADNELKKTVSVAVPNIGGEGFTRTTVRVEYEWNPPRCPGCCVFGHTADSCPKRDVISQNSQRNKDDEGYVEVMDRRKTKNKAGVVMKPKPKFEYRPVTKKNHNTSGYQQLKPKGGNANKHYANKDPIGNFANLPKTFNSFAVLEDSDTEEVYTEARPYGEEGNITGASTSVVNGSIG